MEEKEKNPTGLNRIIHWVTSPVLIICGLLVMFLIAISLNVDTEETYMMSFIKNHIIQYIILCAILLSGGIAGFFAKKSFSRVLMLQLILFLAFLYSWIILPPDITSF